MGLHCDLSNCKLAQLGMRHDVAEASSSAAAAAEFIACGRGRSDLDPPLRAVF